MRKSVGVIILAAVLVVQGATARAQNQTPPGGTSKQQNPFIGSPLTWSVDPIIDRYVSSLARSYNLNKDQEEYTRQLLNQRVKKFLNDYEKDVRTLFTEYLYLQRSGDALTPEMAKDLAKRGGPLVSAIKKEILDGNMKWREILDEKQRQMHDRDLKQMDTQFQQFEETLDNWSKGKVSPTDLTGKPEGRTPRPTQIRKFEDVWELKVNSFIQEYGLDAGQQETARSILRELREEAKRYRDKRQEEFGALDAKLKEVYESSPKTDPEELKKAQETVKRLNDERSRLERPIREDLWNQLLARLERIPTEDQRRVHDERRRKLEVRFPTTRRAGSQPADSQPGSISRPAEARAAADAPAVK